MDISMRKLRRSFSVLALALLVAVPCSAQLLNISTGLPRTMYNQTGATTYNATTHALTITTAVPLTTLFAVPPPKTVTGTKLLTITIYVDNAGHLIGGNPSGPDFQMSGTVVNGATTYTGTLLTGEILEFGYSGSNP